jgi:hypothetical protein
VVARMTAEPIELRVDDVIRLRKPHPCGGYDWRVTRLGADIGLKCESCGRHVMLDRITVERRLKKIMRRSPVDAS